MSSDNPGTLCDPLAHLLGQLQESDQQSDPVCCRLCRTAITWQQYQATIGIKHQHRFTNPEGVSYQISCFHQAPGCSISGSPSHQHSWFYGYRWQFAHCGDCGEQLGWYYQRGSGGNSSGNGSQRFFFGLISDRLASSE